MFRKSSLQLILLIVLLLGHLYFLLEMYYWTDSASIIDENLLPNFSSMLYEQLTVQVAVLMILIVETIVWWRMRKLTYKPGLFWGYYFFLFVVLIALPLEAKTRDDLYFFLQSGHLIPFALGMVVGHGFLIAALRQAYQDNGTSDQGDLPDAIGDILD